MRKSSLPPELANLTDAQLAQLDTWLDRFTYPRVQQLFRETHGLDIGAMKLCRYYKRRLKARALTPPGQPSLTPADLVAIRNGAPFPDARLNTELLQLRVLDLVRGVKSAYELRELHQVATYEQRCTMTEKEIELEQRRADHRLVRAELRKQELAFQKWRSAATHLRASTNRAPFTLDAIASSPSPPREAGGEGRGEEAPIKTSQLEERLDPRGPRAVPPSPHPQPTHPASHPMTEALDASPARLNSHS